MVVAGRAQVEIAGESHPIQAGSVISVQRDVEHKSVEITEDLAVAVVFGPTEGQLSET